MENWWVYAIIVLCTAMGYLYGARAQKVSGKEEGEDPKPVGIIFLDKGEGEMYSQFFVDPMLFGDGDRIVMTVDSVDSQQKQD